MFAFHKHKIHELIIVIIIINLLLKGHWLTWKMAFTVVCVLTYYQCKKL